MHTEKQIRTVIREELKKALVSYKKVKLDEQAEADVDFDPEKSGLNLPKGLQKLLDPDLPPNKFAQLDSQLDDQGKPQQQAIATAVYALNYADNNEADAKTLLTKAIALLPKLVQAQEAGAEEKAQAQGVT